MTGAARRPTETQQPPAPRQKTGKTEAADHKQAKTRYEEERENDQVTHEIATKAKKGPDVGRHTTRQTQRGKGQIGNRKRQDKPIERQGGLQKLDGGGPREKSRTREDYSESASTTKGGDTGSRGDSPRRRAQRDRSLNRIKSAMIDEPTGHQRDENTQQHKKGNMKKARLNQTKRQRGRRQHKSQDTRARREEIRHSSQKKEELGQ